MSRAGWRRPAAAAVLLLCAGLLPPALATVPPGAPLQPVASIQAAAVAAAQAFVARGTSADELRVVAAPPDPRLRLRACAGPLAGTVAAGQAGATRLTVEVKCAAPVAWRLYVPVQVAGTRPVLVAARTLARDTILAPGDVRLAPRELATAAYGTFAEVDQVVGLRLRRDLPEGTVLSPGLVDQPPLVRRGQEVTLEARTGGLSVRMAGVARRDGRLGETIPVQNVSSGEVREAVVRSAKSVEVLLR